MSSSEEDTLTKRYGKDYDMIDHQTFLDDLKNHKDSMDSSGAGNKSKNKNLTRGQEEIVDKLKKFLAKNRDQIGIL